MNSNFKDKSWIIRYKDGSEIDTAGPLRIVEFEEGLYITGFSTLIPILDAEEGEEIIKKLNKKYTLDLDHGVRNYLNRTY